MTKVKDEAEAIEKAVDDVVAAITTSTEMVEITYSVGIGFLGTAFLAFGLGNLLGLPGALIAFSVPCFILMTIGLAQFFSKS